MAFLENNFEEEGFEGFGPGTEFFTHRGLMCQARAMAARRSMGLKPRNTQNIRNEKPQISWPCQEKFAWFAYFAVENFSNRAWRLPAARPAEIPSHLRRKACSPPVSAPRQGGRTGPNTSRRSGRQIGRAS